jgi:hypothetical protein
MLKVGIWRTLTLGRQHNRSIFAGDANGEIARAVVNDYDVVAGMQSFQAAAQT